MELYHYTSNRHLERILASGVLVPTESNIGAPNALSTIGWSPRGGHIGPDVVWFTTDSSSTGHGLEGSNVDKTEVRVVVDLPDAHVHHWPTWAREHGIDERWYQLLGRGRRPETWYVVERPVSHEEWTRVEGTPLKAERNSPCPCGSGRKFKRCHEGRTVLWQPSDGIEITMTPEEARTGAGRLTTDALGRPTIESEG